jgi:GDP-L-fucose synthase
MKKDAAIYVAGHKGLVGSAILRKLKSEGYSNLITRSFQELDLRDRTAVDEFFKKEQPEFIFLAAAKVGGILANNTYPVDFLRDNLRIQTNIIESAYKYGVKKLLFLGSSCIYPKLAPQPIKEEYLLTGELEPTNEPYAIAKIAGIKLCQAYNRQYQANFISVMPTNLYGPGDNFDLETSHVMPALIRKFHEAKINSADQVVVWGSGKPFREFLHVDDLADACLFLMNNYNSSEIINIGTGKDLSIAELAYLIKDTVGYHGDIVFDTSKPDGTPRKLLDVSKLFDMGWKPRITLEEGIRTAYNWYQEHQKPLS